MREMNGRTNDRARHFRLGLTLSLLMVVGVMLTSGSMMPTLTATSHAPSGLRADSFDRPLKFTQTNLNSTTTWCVTVVTESQVCDLGSVTAITWQVSQYSNFTWSELEYYGTGADNYWFNATPYEGVAYTGSNGVTVPLTYAFENHTAFLVQQWSFKAPELNVTPTHQTVKFTMNGVAPATIWLYVFATYLVNTTPPLGGTAPSIAAPGTNVTYHNWTFGTAYGADAYQDLGSNQTYGEQGYYGPSQYLAQTDFVVAYPYDANVTAHSYWFTLTAGTALLGALNVRVVTYNDFGDHGNPGWIMGIGGSLKCEFPAIGYFLGPLTQSTCLAPVGAVSHGTLKSITLIEVVCLQVLWQGYGQGLIGNASLSTAMPEASQTPYSTMNNGTLHTSVSGSIYYNANGWFAPVSDETRVYTQQLVGGWSPTQFPNGFDMGIYLNVNGPTLTMYELSDSWLIINDN